MSFEEVPNMGSNLTIVVNGKPRELVASSSVADLLEALALNPRQVAVEVNLELIPRGLHAERELVDGDQLEIVTLAGGG